MNRAMIKWQQQQKRRNRSGHYFRQMGKVVTHNYVPGTEKYERDDEDSFMWVGYEDNPTEEININVDLVKPNEKFELYGILLGMGNKSLVINVNVVHRAVNTRSRLVLKGILTEKSSIKFNGITHIERGAKQTNAWLECRLLLLSDQAKGQAIPALEILENDVKAGHASTAGRINDLELFYLQSRGLSPKKAKRLIAEGFVKSVFDEGNFGGGEQNLKKWLNQLHYD